jgi:hypothetical protein
MSTLMNINKISMWIRADGRLNKGEGSHDFGGVVYPRGTAGVVYQDGMLWGGIVNDGKVVRFEDRDYRIRVGGSTYRSGLQPGRIITRGVAEDPEDPDVRIWRIRRDWQEADLTQDAAEHFSIPINCVTHDQIDEVRMQYQKDWNEWPWEKGAPFYDDNGNGIMDDGEEPGLAYADQVVWYPANDLDYDLNYDYRDSPPIGMEMQVTYWAYDRPHTGQNALFNAVLQHVVFKRVRLVYKGCIDTPDTARIDSMYIGQWSDVDLGSASDDLVGCDTLLNMGFVYNGNDTDERYGEFNLPPPTFGYVIVHGPVVPSSGDRAMFDFRVKENYKNLGITAFTYVTPGGPDTDPSYNYEGSLGWYKLFQGYMPLTNYRVFFPFPPGVTPNSFPLSGDPVAGTGLLDGLSELYSFSPGDRRFLCSSGPFSMALSDTQEVIIGLVGGMGSDRLSSITEMKRNVKYLWPLVRGVVQLGFKDEEYPEIEDSPADFMLYPNYPNPFNDGTTIEYDLPLQKDVRLFIYNILGQTVKVFVDEIQEPGYYVYWWDGTDDRGEKVPTGMYLLRLEAGYWVLTRKMMLLE